jgi:DNA-directed RNA polymerase subunit RPC12/RpoP
MSVTRHKAGPKGKDQSNSPQSDDHRKRLGTVKSGVVATCSTSVVIGRSMKSEANMYGPRCEEKNSKILIKSR